jgi:hypothetical protein
MTDASKRITYVCPACGSEAVGHTDVTTYWDDKTQTWEIGGDCLKSLHCFDCDLENDEAAFERPLENADEPA